MNILVHYSIRGRTASAIAQSAERALREGRLPPGSALPTVRALARELKVSPATVAAAYRDLRQRGLVVAQGRRGTRVAARPPLAFPRSEPRPRPSLRNLAEGNPDPRLLPSLAGALRQVPRRPRLYGEPPHRLLGLAARAFEADGVPSQAVCVVAGAMDGIERVLQAHLRPGDRVAVEDPGYDAVLDLVGALGLAAEPIGLDDDGLRPEELHRALASGCRALVLTPRAQNPTGAALTEARAHELRRLLDAHPDLLVLEDDHAGAVAGAPVVTLCSRSRARWAVVRSVSKSLGPDLRLALVAGDPETVARVSGRQALGSGWVSHLVQDVVAAFLSDAATLRGLRRAAATYRERREALRKALARRGIAAHGRSGLNVWVPVREEAAVVAGMAAAGFAVRAGERYRIRSRPAVRLTTAALRAEEAEAVAATLARVLEGDRPVRSA
jgi:DNA-binding transcriptional MocR family regulator